MRRHAEAVPAGSRASRRPGISARLGIAALGLSILLAGCSRQTREDAWLCPDAEGAARVQHARSLSPLAASAPLLADLTARQHGCVPAPSLTVRVKQRQLATLRLPMLPPQRIEVAEVGGFAPVDGLDAESAFVASDWLR
ncbi:hypothetical protein LDO26_15820 [Luteimonas sp. BDR2-5]|uniref:hypothetical protein n=1 Tax=Proluteimonas luteida TaxID=2878685 RepID=UPI001E5DAF67|nr:hypothetical protein [Luteimonas sp. BDR2-5]MCD9029661.1 hypothetical protein [Luteimonas sp. BDR2-5]